MNEDYCDYKLSLALKTCGFDEPCDHYKVAIPDTLHEVWDKEEQRYHLEEEYECYPKITLWQAQKWLREKRGIDICAWRSFSVNHSYHYQLVKDNNWENAIVQSVCAGRNYEQSLAGAIFAALKLIKKGE